MKRGRRVLCSIREGRSDDQAQDDLGVCGADDIQGMQKRMNYKINFIVFGVCVIKCPGM